LAATARKPAIAVMAIPYYFHAMVRENSIVVPEEVRPLIEALKSRLRPDTIWLFGSRARGDNWPDSDWDILVALPDDAEPDLLDPLLAWEIQREAGIPATIVATTSGALADSWGSPNTIGYDLAKHGRLLHG
jgi:uncharacterized protein